MGAGVEEVASRFNIAFVRDTFIIAEPKQAEQLQKLLKPLQFLVQKDGRDFLNHGDSQHFVIAACDFTVTKQMQVIAKLFGEMNHLLAHRVIFATAPEAMLSEYLLFSQEIGARYVACGVSRAE